MDSAQSASSRAKVAALSVDGSTPTRRRHVSRVSRASPVRPVRARVSTSSGMVGKMVTPQMP